MQTETVLSVLTGWFSTWSALHFTNNPFQGRTARERLSLLDKYRDLLAQFPTSCIDAACRNLTQNVQFFPNPADIRDEIERELYPL